MKLRQLLLAGLLAAAVVGIGVLLTPSREEQVAMLIRDGQTDAAHRLLREAFNSGDRSAATSIALYKLQGEGGDAETAVAALEAYVVSRPGDAEARSWLTHLYKIVNNQTKYLESLEALVRAHPTRDHVQELLGVYRLRSLFEKEEALLYRLRESALLTPVDLSRLGYLLAQAGKWSEAADALIGAEAGAEESGFNHRTLLFRALVQSGRQDDSVRRVAGWVAKDRNVDQMEPLMLVAEAAGQRAAGLGAVDACSGVLPNCGLTVAERVLARGHWGLARDLVVRSLDAIDASDAGAAQRFVSLALRLDGAPLVIERLAALARQPVPPPVAGVLAEAIADQVGDAVLLDLNRSVPDAFWSERPVLAARLALAQGNRMLARRRLLETDVSSLDPKRQAAWARLLEQTVGVREAMSLVSGLYRERRLSDRVLVLVAGEISGTRQDGVTGTNSGAGRGVDAPRL